MVLDTPLTLHHLCLEVRKHLWMQLEEYMNRLDYAKLTLGYAFKEGQWDGDIDNMTDEEIIVEADRLEVQEQYSYDKWKEEQSE